MPASFPALRRASGQCLLAALVALAALVPAVHAQSYKVGFVDPFRIENESAQAQQAIADIKRDFDGREKQLREQEKQLVDMKSTFEKNAATMRESDRVAREREFTQRAQRFEQARTAFAEDFELRRREALARVIEDANLVIRQIAEQGKFDLILQQAVFFSKQVDITDQVLKAMAERSRQKR